MHSRIAPSSFPAHNVEIGFLNDLTANLKLKMAGLEHDADVFNPNGLAAWNYDHRRELARCSHGYPLRDHNSALFVCDGFIELLKEQRWQEAEAQLPAVRNAINEFEQCVMDGGIKY